MPQAFLHGQKHVGVASCLDMDHPVGVQPGQVKGRGEKVAPAQAPENRSIDPCKDACQKDGRARIIRKIGTAGDLVQSARGDARSRQTLI